MEKSAELNQILIEGAKKIIAINKDPENLHGFIMERLLNTFYYSAKCKDRDNVNSDFSALWCMMWDLVMPLMEKKRDMINIIAQGINNQYGASQDKGFDDRLVGILTAMKEGDDFGASYHEEGFATLIALSGIIKEVQMQHRIERKTA